MDVIETSSGFRKFPESDTVEQNKAAKEATINFLDLAKSAILDENLSACADLYNNLMQDDDSAKKFGCVKEQLKSQQGARYTDAPYAIREFKIDNHAFVNRLLEEAKAGNCKAAIMIKELYETNLISSHHSPLQFEALIQSGQDSPEYSYPRPGYPCKPEDRYDDIIKEEIPFPPLFCLILYLMNPTDPVWK